MLAEKWGAMSGWTLVGQSDEMSGKRWGRKLVDRWVEMMEKRWARMLVARSVETTAQWLGWMSDEMME